MESRKKSILIISFNPVFPLTHGGAVAQYYFLEKLHEKYDITLITEINNEFDLESVNKFSKIFQDINILLFDNRSNKPWYFLLYKLYKRFIKYIYKLDKLNKYGIKSNNLFTQPSVNNAFNNFLIRILSKHTFDIIQCEFFETLPLLEVLPCNTNKVFVHHELRFKRLENENIYDEKYVTDTKNYEIKQLQKANHIIVFNADDKNRLDKYIKNVSVSPFGISDALIEKSSISHKFNRLIFLGSQSNPPNKAGLDWFLKKIYIPNIDILPVLYVLGNWSLEFLSEFRLYNKINFTGYVGSLKEIYEESILIVPVTSGSGLRTKILVAMANNVPVLTTPFAAEGLFNQNDKEHFSFFNSEFEFINYFKNTEYHNYFQQKAQNASDYYKKHFSEEKLTNIRNSVYENWEYLSK